MAEDLLDYWVRLIIPIFPANAWVVASYSNGNHIILIDWKLGNDPKRPGKRSRKIQITIKEDAIDDYLNRNKPEREIYGITLKKLIGERYHHFVPDNDSLTTRSVPTEKWLISKDILNALSHASSIHLPPQTLPQKGED
jgi:hypothetical protein